MSTFTRGAILVLASAVLSAGRVVAEVPLVEQKGVGALTACPTTLTRPTAYHVDKVVFVITGPLLAATPGDQPALDALPRNTELDVKLRDNPRKVAHLKYMLLSFLGAAAIEPNATYVQLIEVGYSTFVCP